MMKLATYFILAVAVVFVLITAVSMVVAAFQVAIYIAATVLIIWVLTSIATYLNKKSVKQPPP